MSNKKETTKTLTKEFKDKSEHEIFGFVTRLFDYSKIIDKYNCISCERELSENETKYIDKVNLKLKKLCDDFQIKFTIQGDPRGCGVKLILPSGMSNSIFERAWNVDTTNNN